VHVRRGLLEVRHHKNLGPAHLWDKWEIVTRAEFGHVDLVDLLHELGADQRLMLDLKGIRRGLAPAVAAALRAQAPGLTVCTKHWWMVDVFDPDVRRVLSASNRVGLARLRRRLRATPTYGACVRLSLLTPALVAELHRGADVVLTWPVDSAADLARARALDVDAVISRDLELLVGVLNDR
jgi:hypothetical protein